MRRQFCVLPILIFALAATLAACSSSDTPGEGTAGRLTALSIIDAAAFHAMDEGLNKPGGTIDPQWLGRVTHSRIAVASVAWPKELQEDAKTFTDAAATLATALEADNSSTAAPAAKTAHEAQHELSTKGWEGLAKATGTKAPSHD